MEWAVNAGWINSEETCRQWLDEQLDGPVAQQDLPLLARLYQCLEAGDTERAEYWDAMVLAMRETSELRHEEQQRGAALVTLLDVLKTRVLITPRSMVGAFASFCVAERINLTDCLAGYAYSWLDGQVTAAIKLVPLGQSQGQGMLYHSAQRIPSLVASALLLNDDAVGYTSPALAMASCLHETQYTRLFRS
jgi:urease accessory protein